MPPGPLVVPVLRTSLTEVETLRRAAVDMISEAWGALARDHVVPCSRYRPYVRVGRDYEGTSVMGRPAFAQFSAALRNLYPEWFDAEPGAFPRWYPDNLVCSFIDACVAELSRQGESGDAPSDAVEAMVLELVDYLDAPEAQVGCARRVSHLMTEDKQEMTVAGVTILAQRRWEEIRQIADVIPTARAAFNGDPPFSFAPPEATLVSYATGPDPFKLRAAAERCIDRLLLAIHLLDGATTAGVFQVTGETTLVCRYSAGVDVLVYDEHPVPVRPAVISPASVQPVERLLALYDGTEHRAPKEVVHGLQMAVLKFTTSFAPKPWFEKVVDLTTALEATLSGTDKADVTMRICSRAAQILSTDRDSPQTIYGDVKALYDLRSNLVHGSVITEKQLDKWIASVSVVSPDRTPRMRIELVVDRLRDLVRRSILARLVLNDDGRWRLRGDPPPIDQLLADPGTAAKWREAWHQRMGELGAAEAVHPAVPLLDSIFDGYPGKDDG
jgi:hypothetical protein